LILFVLGGGALFLFVQGLWMYMKATATPLHPDPRQVPSVTASGPPPRWSEAVEKGRQIVRAAISERNLTGVSIAVGQGGDIVWEEGFGWADLENRLPVSPAHRFRIGTASTALTSAAVGLLVESGQLNLDSTIQTYVPEFPVKEWPVTVRQLMGHLSGVRNDGGDEGPLFSQRCERPLEALRFFADRPLLFEPETRFRHSSYGWILVSAAIEAASGEPFLEFMKTRIFDPLAMRDTVPDATPRELPNQATSYFPRFAADPRYGPDRMRRIELSCYAGAGVFLSTPSDLVRFAMAIVSGRLLQPDTVRLLQAPQRLASGEETGHGLDWALENVAVAGNTMTAVRHDGELLGGMVASLVTLRDRRLVVAVVANISYADTASIASRILEPFAAAAAQSPGDARD
jgi:CubicO group peptidase (beta-lactamase class C family)